MTCSSPGNGFLKRGFRILSACCTKNRSGTSPVPWRVMIFHCAVRCCFQIICEKRSKKLKDAVPIMIGTFRLISSFFTGAISEDKMLTMSTTTITGSSGYRDLLLPEFKKAAGIAVKVLAKGTGAVLKDGQDGNLEFGLKMRKVPNFSGGETWRAVLPPAARSPRPAAARPRPRPGPLGSSRRWPDRAGSGRRPSI